MLGCYICGQIEGGYCEDELGNLVCEECGNKSMVDFQTALDILIDVGLHGNLPPRLEEYLQGVEDARD